MPHLLQTPVQGWGNVPASLAAREFASNVRALLNRLLRDGWAIGVFGMRTIFGKLLSLAAFLVGINIFSPAIAQSPGETFLVSCENGRNYTLRPRAVSIVGELVTGYLLTGRSGSVHVRLVPMGDGYRYAGRGVWLTGIRSSAVLNFGPDHAVPCTVAIAETELRQAGRARPISVLY
jgi:hypothetical protein